MPTGKSDYLAKATIMGVNPLSSFVEADGYKYTLPTQEINPNLHRHHPPLH
jgi:hypothetical protein